MRGQIISILISMLFFATIIPLCNSLSLNIQENILMSDNDEFDLLIITKEKFTDLIDPLISNKEKNGIQTQIATVEDIYDKYQGRDKPEQIKNAIRSYFDTLNIKYVLLIGNFKDIPVRYCYNYDNYQSWDICFISDLYYADIYDSEGFFSDWDGNDNGLYGEWNGSEAQDKDISLTPEICVGRLPCHNRFEVRIMVNKIITYEEQTYGSDWFSNFVVAGGDTYSPARGYNGEIFNGNEGEVNTEIAIQYMNDFTPMRLWASNNKLTTVNLLKAINHGCGFLYLSGHGSPNLWATHPTNSSDSIGPLPNVLFPLMINGYKLPVCIVGGCHNSQFDVHPLRIVSDPFYYSTWIYSCWSWKITSNFYGGSIATIGCTGLGWGGKEFGGGGNDWLNIHFFEVYANGTHVLGEVWKHTILEYLQLYPIEWETPNGDVSSINAKTVQEWVLIGDPSLKIGGYP